MRIEGCKCHSRGYAPKGFTGFVRYRFPRSCRSLPATPARIEPDPATKRVSASALQLGACPQLRPLAWVREDDPRTSETHCCNGPTTHRCKAR